MDLIQKQYELEVSNNIMKELFAYNPTISDMFAMRERVKEMPEAHTGEAPEHLFCNGMYTRILNIPAGDLIFGKKHKKGHFTMLVQGRASIVDDKGTQLFEAPSIWISQPEAQRVIYAYDDCVLLTVHRTDSTDLDVVEEELIIKE